MQPTNNNKSLYARYYPLNKIGVMEIRQMYAVFQRYYQNTDVETFIKDLSRKSGVILVRTKKEKRLVGFSTLVSMDVNEPGLKGKGIFSGDTIIEKEYWGSRALQLCFFRYVLAQKLMSPHRPVFWFLISKGYKTFLLMANNFKHYYPNPEGRDSHLQGVVQTYCEQLFPGHYDQAREILDFGENAQCLRGDVAAISEELRLTHEKIRFFEIRNPTWTKGTELPCVGIIDYASAFGFVSKAVRSLFGGKTKAAKATGGVRALPGRSAA